MKAKTAFNKQRDATMAMRELGNRAVFYGLPHSEILAKQTSIMEAMGKAPQSRRSYVQGYAQRIFDMWFEHDLIWCHISPEGKYYSAYKGTRKTSFCEDVGPLYEAGRGAEIATWKHGHFWIEASEREHGFGRAPKPFHEEG